MIDTGGTIVKAAEAIKEAGANQRGRPRDGCRSSQPASGSCRVTSSTPVVVTGHPAPVPEEKGPPTPDRPADRAADASSAIREVFSDGLRDLDVRRPPELSPHNRVGVPQA
jgi:ribose-phosphate pyrophosphokinase